MTLVQKTVAISLVLAAAVCAVAKFPIRLGLDLRGGTSLILTLRVEDSLNAQAVADADVLRESLRTRGIGFHTVDLTQAASRADLPHIAIRVSGIDPTQTTAFTQTVEHDLPNWQATNTVLTLRPQAIAALTRSALERTHEVLDRRINAYGLAETSLQPYGTRGDQLMVQLPGSGDSARIRHLLQTRAVLEWYAVHSGPYATRADVFARNGGIMPPGSKLMAFPRQQDALYLLTGPPVVRGEDVRDASASEDAGVPATRFVLSSQAAGRFERFTTANLGQRAAVVLDGKILSVAVIENTIRDTGVIRGASSAQEAADLAIGLRSGAMPAGVEVSQEHTIDASLGADSIRQGLRAGLVGLAAVVAVMLVYYRRAGINATIVLLFNALLLVAVLAACGAVLTLPGIAGIILTIGMAVDSNVLIFERIREETRAGLSPGAALDAGFKRAFATLIDTHVTTVVSCAFLFLFGTPAVKGFAVTLVIGLVANLFTAVFCSKVLFEWELRGSRAPSRAIETRTA